MTVIILLGFLFGLILAYAKLNQYDVISGMATLEDLTVAKAIAIAIGVGAILVNLEISLGLATYHVKPFILGGIVLGGLIFGIGMAILGYCPGTLAVSLGEGSLDALLGVIGGIAGGIIFIILLPFLAPLIGANLGSISFNTFFANRVLFWFVTVILAIFFIWLAFRLNKSENSSDLKWLYAGIMLAILNAIIFLKVVGNRPIGASTAYPYISGILTGMGNNNYFLKIKKPGNWEVFFLLGAFFSGLVFSLVRKEFKITVIHERWKKYKGDSNTKRLIWSFIGGFILIFGARMAGGCTSGHILSGGMQLAISSLVFAIFVFVGLLITGRIFLKTKK